MNTAAEGHFSHLCSVILIACPKFLAVPMAKGAKGRSDMRNKMKSDTHVLRLSYFSRLKVETQSSSPKPCIIIAWSLTPVGIHSDVFEFMEMCLMFSMILDD